MEAKYAGNWQATLMQILCGMVPEEKRIEHRTGRLTQGCWTWQPGPNTVIRSTWNESPPQHLVIRVFLEGKSGNPCSKVVTWSMLREPFNGWYGLCVGHISVSLHACYLDGTSFMILQCDRIEITNSVWERYGDVGAKTSFTSYTSGWVKTRAVFNFLIGIWKAKNKYSLAYPNVKIICVAVLKREKELMLWSGVGMIL